MTTPSYRERLRAERAAASAKRKAELAEWRDRVALRCEIRRLALLAVKDAIRASGDKVQLYSVAQLRARADEYISAQLVAEAKAKIADRAEREIAQRLHRSKAKDRIERMAPVS